VVDGYMMVGFSRGWVIAISTHMKEIGEELQSLKVHEGTLIANSASLPSSNLTMSMSYLVGLLFDLCYSPQLNKLATCGDDGVRVVDMTDFKVGTARAAIGVTLILLWNGYSLVCTMNRNLNQSIVSLRRKMVIQRS
jgi:hypothetical protein